MQTSKVKKTLTKAEIEANARAEAKRIADEKRGRDPSRIPGVIKSFAFWLNVPESVVLGLVLLMKTGAPSNEIDDEIVRVTERLKAERLQSRKIESQKK